MKRSILLIIALAAAAQAQQAVPCLKLAKVAIPGHTLRQQESTIAKLTFKAQGCAVVDLHGSTTATFESSPGLDIAVNDIEFKDPDKTRTSAGIQKARQLSLLVKLSASPDFAVGEHKLHGLLTYQAIDSSSNPAPETLAIDFPLKVVPHKPYKKVALPDNGRPHQKSAFVQGLEIAGIAVIWIPLMIVLGLECLVTGNCWEC